MQKKKTAAEVAQRNIVGEQRSESSVEDAVRMVRISFFGGDGKNGHGGGTNVV